MLSHVTLRALLFALYKQIDYMAFRDNKQDKFLRQRRGHADRKGTGTA